ncbi:spermatogenesis-associated protein 45-like isoform X2 [Phyllopteryx taeniolatus]|uniref:spermatogenesis-associated protein 45-like isoform X2 n=1 Tax=Phyllopteryx taeniolatus TaxID=161469 RepID=UPI002AD2AF3F|nr:spermatogenesis-associated protein 45-like isoform X2 [Phyllopteryx taeniolatus]
MKPRPGLRSFAVRHMTENLPQTNKRNMTLQDINRHRETWCRVESNARCAWERVERKHYSAHLRSSPALLAAMTGGPQRGAPGRGQPPRPDRLPERRHFEESYDSQLPWGSGDSLHRNGAR